MKPLVIYKITLSELLDIYAYNTLANGQNMGT